MGLNYNWFVNIWAPWFLRGSGDVRGSDTGVFALDVAHGLVSNNVSFRG